MKISSINIDGFGIFHDVFVEGLDSSGITLFLGQNEAGKSTMLAFIKTILFGFPHANSRELIYPPLAGGIRGGRLDLRANNGQLITVERTPGKKVAGNVTVSHSDGKTGTEELLHQLMGGVTFPVFKNIYAFSLSELQTINTLRDENVKNVIYGASIGSAMLALPKTEKELGDRLDQLFRPKGKNQLINKKLAKYEGIKAELVDVRHKQKEFDELVQKLRQVEEGIQFIQHKLFDLNQEQATLNSYSRLWQDWKDYQEYKKDLALIPENIDCFPTRGIQQLEDEQKSLKTHQANLYNLHNEIKQNHTQVKSLVVHSSLIDRGDEIHYFMEQKSIYSECLKTFPVVVNKKKEFEINIQQILKNLGLGWDEKKVVSIDRSIFTRETIRQSKTALNIKENEVTTAGTIQINKKVDLDKADDEVNQTMQWIEEIGLPESEMDPELIQQLQSRRNEFAHNVREIEKQLNRLQFQHEKMTNSIRDIDSTWDEADISRFDISLSARETIEGFRMGLDKGQQASHDRKAHFNIVKAALLKARDQFKDAEVRLQASSSPSVSSHKEVDHIKVSIQRLHQSLFEEKEVKREIRHLEERLQDKEQELNRLAQTTQKISSRVPTIFVWVALCCIILLCFLFIASHKWEAAIMTGLFFVVAIALIGYRKYGQIRPPTSSPSELQRESINIQTATIEKDIGLGQHRLSDIEAEMEDLAKSLNLPLPITRDSLSRKEKQIEEKNRLLEKQSQLAQTVEKSKKEVDRVNDELNHVKTALVQTDQHLQEIEAKWRDYLLSLKLSPELTPVIVREIFSKVEIIRQHISTTNGLKENIREMETTRDEYLRMATKVPDLGKLTKKDPADFLAKVDQLLVELEDQRKHRKTYEQAKQLLEEKRKRHSILEKEYQKANQSYYQLVDEKRTLLNRWRDWLAERELPADLSPESAMEAFDQIMVCTEKINQRNQLNIEIENRKKTIEEYKRGIIKLFDELNRPIPTSQKLPIAISELSRDLEKSKGNLIEKTQIERQIKKDEVKIQFTQAQIDHCSRQIRILLEEGQALNEKEFRDRAHQFSVREKLLVELAQAEKSLRRLSGEPNLEKLKVKLQQLSKEDIQLHENELSITQNDLQNELEDLRNEKAHLNLCIGKIKSADDIARIRADEERIREEIRGLAFEWSRNAMAKFLIQKAKEKFEIEQQPKVFQDARVFFQKITNSRYHDLVAPIGKDSIEVVTAKKQRKKTEQLSRGTAEQLYLSIRFGYIRNRSQNGEALPVIMDDILVNFDPIRAQNAAQSIFELAKNHQVLFFTCHPETVDIFKHVSRDIAVCEIKNGKIIKQNI